jgi:hypothetical protein
MKLTFGVFVAVFILGVSSTEPKENDIKGLHVK